MHYRLRDGQMVSLVLFIQANHGNMIRDRVNVDTAAKMATEELGFEVRRQHIRNSIKNLGIEMLPYPKKRNGNDFKKYDAVIRALNGEIEQLKQRQGLTVGGLKSTNERVEQLATHWADELMKRDAEMLRAYKDLERRVECASSVQRQISKSFDELQFTVADLQEKQAAALVPA